MANYFIIFTVVALQFCCSVYSEDALEKESLNGTLTNASNSSITTEYEDVTDANTMAPSISSVPPMIANNDSNPASPIPTANANNSPSTESTTKGGTSTSVSTHPPILHSTGTSAKTGATKPPKHNSSNSIYGHLTYMFTAIFAIIPIIM